MAPSVMRSDAATTATAHHDGDAGDREPVAAERLVFTRGSLAGNRDFIAGCRACAVHCRSPDDILAPRIE
jgi:hypothetical protein